MTPKLRRVVSFVVLAGGGVLLLVLLSDDAGGPKGPILGKSQPAAPDQGTLGLLDEKTGTSTQITLSKVSFERTRPVEVAPGRVEERVDLRIDLENGRGTPEGDLAMDSPVITFVDALLGADRGRVRADSGVCFGMGSSVGPLQLQVERKRPEAFALRGHVIGDLPLASGRNVGLQADELRFDDRTIDAPGRVVLSWGALTVTGTHLTSDATTGLFTLESDVVVELPATGDAPPVELHASRLVWHVPLDGDGRGWGELLGPVTGTSGPGGSLSTARMELLADATAVTLVGAADVRLTGADGASRGLQAERIVLALGGEDGLSLSSAEGGVVLRLDEPGGRSTTLRTATLASLGDELVAEGQLVLEQPGLSLSGRGWRWNQRTRRLSIASELELRGTDATSPLAGLVLRAAGLDAHLPEEGLEAAHVSIPGPVTGRLADGSTIACAGIEVDGAASSATLAGRVVIDVPRRDAQRHVEADELVLGLDDGLLGSLSARGDVRALLRDAGGLPTWLDAERVDLAAGVTTAPGPVRVERGALVLTGRDLRADETLRRLDLEHDAVVELRRADDAVDGLRSPGGLTWWLPADETSGAGHGVLHGPVSGRTSDGATFGADRVELDASLDALGLLGQAHVELPDGSSLAGDTLAARRVDGRLLVRAPGRVRWTDGPQLVEGEGLDLDEALGTLRLARSVRLERRDAAGDLVYELRGGGPLEWSVDRDGDRAARGTLGGGVTGRDAEGATLSGSSVTVDEAGGRLLLDGPARVASGAGDTLDASGPIEVLRGADGRTARLAAREHVVLARAGEGESWSARSDTLAFDRVASTAVLSGAIRLEHRAGEDLTTLVTGPDGRLQAVTDAEDALLFVDVVGRLVATAGDIVAEADSASFDVRDDHLVLEGDCRFAGIDGGMQAPRVEIWPRQSRWMVPHSVIELQGASEDG